MTGIPILDTILDLIMNWRLGLAMMGLAVIAISALLMPVIPDGVSNAKRYLVGMIAGGVILALLGGHEESPTRRLVIQAVPITRASMPAGTRKEVPQP